MSETDEGSKMRLIHRRDVIKSVPLRFRETYGSTRKEGAWRTGKTRGEVLADLEALDVETCPAEAVDVVIGNPSWTKNECDECGQNCGTLIRIGQEPDYDTRWLDLCGGCLSKASAILSQSQEGRQP